MALDGTLEQQRDAVVASGLFAPDWYLQHNPDVAAAGLDPARHFCSFGWREGRRPAPSFDPSWYLEQNDDVRASGHNPLLHYCRYGRREGRAPRPDAEIIAASGLFDTNYYLVGNPDIRAQGMPPLAHFCAYGWREGRRPNLYFDPTWYISTYEKAGEKAARRNPLTHYILHGEEGGRRPVVYFDPVHVASRAGLPAGTSALQYFLAHRRRQTISPLLLFDIGFYLAQCGTRIGTSRDPFAHYLRAGMTEDLAPSPLFDAAAYRRRYLGRPSRHFQHLFRPETHNPLVHYLLASYG